MTRGHLVSKAAILLARRIGGAERDDWVRAMAAEWDALDNGKTRWALGCLAASLRDRLRRERRFIAAMLLAVPGVYIWSATFMTLVAPSMRASDAPTFAWIAAYLFNPLVVPLALGWLYPARAKAIGFALGALFLFAPVIVSALLFGVPPIGFFKAVARDLGLWLAMYPVALATWTATARLGARFAGRRARSG